MEEAGLPLALEWTAAHGGACSLEGERETVAPALLDAIEVEEDE